MTVKWLNRSAILTPYLALCTSEEDFARVCKHVNLEKPYPEWVSFGADATQHTFDQAKTREIVCVVCIRPGKQSLEQAYSLLAHEAVHVYEEMKATIQHFPWDNDEVAATCIQYISRVLMEEYKRQRRARRKGK